MFYILFTISLYFYCITASSFYYDDNLVDPNQVVVQIKNGKVLGEKTITSDENEFPYISFQGIPFAEPPVGEKRFQPPLPKRNWNGTLDATKPSPICMQPKIKNPSSIISEDCLYLNVYTQDVQGKYPVMVYIYGGFFFFGAATKSRYGPDYLIQEDVVIVTLNYRLGIFGFLSTQDDVAPGNYGLKDQILALRWVQENIRAFGGDPNDVTLFGESAGSASVSLLLQAESAAGLFHKAIMESGVSLSMFSRSRDPLDVAASTAKRLNISITSSEDLVAGLKKVEANELLSASVTSALMVTIVMNPSDETLFAPCIEPPNEGAVVTQNSYELLENGEFNIVPVIVGFNSAEGNPFESAVATQPLFMMRYELNHKMFIPVNMNVNASQARQVASIIKQEYFGKKAITSQEGSISNFITDDEFVRPINEFVRLATRYTPVYYYEFSHVGNETGADRSLPGVGHGEDVSYLWNTGKTIGEEDVSVRKKLVKLWTNFAKYSNPTPDTDPDLDNVIWNSSNSWDFPYLNIDSELSMRNNPHEEKISFWSSLYQKYGNPPYDTY